MDDIQNNREVQITLVCIVAFAIAFPSYFYYAANNVDGSSSMGGVRDYVVNGEIELIEFDNGAEYIADGTSFALEFHSDNFEDLVDGKNIVGVQVLVSYPSDDEQGSGVACGPSAADTVSSDVSHDEATGSGSGQTAGSHTMVSAWYNSSLLSEEVISGMSESEIADQLEGGDEYEGSYEGSISVTVATGNEVGIAPLGCQRTDDGEDVSYTISVMVLDYTIAPYIDPGVEE